MKDDQKYVINFAVGLSCDLVNFGRTTSWKFNNNQINIEFDHIHHISTSTYLEISGYLGNE